MTNQEEINKQLTELEKLKQVQSAAIDYIVCSGGGAKGAEYSGVYSCLVSTGIMDGVKAIAGSSAGAITAGLISTGISSQRLDGISKKMDFAALVGKSNLVGLNHDGKPLYEFMQQTIRDNIKNFFQENSNIEQIINNLPNEESKNAIKELQERCKQNDGKIYFQDINLLKQIDPLKFKDLIVTAVKRDDGELKIFNCNDTPKVEIALACLASAAIPLYFKPVVIDGAEYVDGGYRDNTPMSYFKNNNEADQNLSEEVTDSPNKSQEAKENGRPLAFAFGSNNLKSCVYIALFTAIKAIYSPNALVSFCMDVLYKALAGVGGNFKYSEVEKSRYNNIRENALNTVLLDSKDVDSLSFAKAKERGDYLHIKGYCQAMEHCNNHGLGKNLDNNIDTKTFFLDVYEKLIDAPPADSFVKKMRQSREIKNKELLSFCEPEKRWNADDNKAVLEQYLLLASTSRNNNGQLDVSTNSMTKIIETLNHSSTKLKIKQDFIELLGINENDKRLNISHAPDRTISKFQFDKSDFQSFLSQREKSIQNGMQR